MGIEMGSDGKGMTAPEGRKEDPLRSCDSPGCPFQWEQAQPCREQPKKINNSAFLIQE